MLQNVLFYVMTDSVDLAKKYFWQYANPHRYVFVADLPTGTNEDGQPLFEHNKGTDLAIMSLADSAIFTHGTYGYFGIFLTKPKQKVLYPINYQANIPMANANFSNWIGIDWKLLPPRQIKSTVRLCQRRKNRRRQIQTFDQNNN